MAAIDDSALRTAAQQLLAAARRSMPGVDWAAQVVESDHGFPGRRGTTKIDGELPTCAQKARPKPQIAAARRLTGWSGPSEACLIRRTRRMIAVQEPASQKFRLRSLGWRGLLAPDD